MIKQLLNSVIAKYRDLSVSRRSIICRSRRLRQTIDLLATDKSGYFAQPRPIVAKYLNFGINYEKKYLVNFWASRGQNIFLFALSNEI